MADSSEINPPVAWRWQVYGIWHFSGGYPVSGAEPLYAAPRCDKCGSDVSMAIEACAKIAETNSELLSGEEIAFETRALALTSQCARPRAFLNWAIDMFGPVAQLRSERLLRFVEEAIELAHAEGMERIVFNKVADRVYSRPAGDTPKEIGQVQACLETFAENIGLSSDDEAQREWERVQSIPRDEWSRRHTAKQALGIALTSTVQQPVANQRQLEEPK